MKLSTAIRRTMKQRQFDAEKLATLAGLARSTVFRLLADETPSVPTLKKLRAAGVAIPRAVLTA